MPEQELVTIDGVELCFERRGDPAGDPLLLVMGYTAQMTNWPAGFLDLLVDRGFHLIRFDNRDSGLSSKTQGPAPPFEALVAAALAGERYSGAPYTLADMAADGIGLLDHLGIERAHVAGASMGGMIVQEMAVNHRDRLLSATSIMSTTGEPGVGEATDEALAALIASPPPEREAAIAHSLSVSRLISGPLFDEAESRARLSAAYDRAFYPAGAAFQLAAIAASGDRTEALGSVTTPFLVIHGEQDQLIGVSGGHATAAAVPNADLLVLAAMGHDLPRPLWPQVVDNITAIAERGELSHA